ncbi:hypothetical protein V500_01784 [Pseudogymnoascus sp. VKM F-4518 (FW-2643)]|nr:hypothetical protein V500_01784 [Pseudogymnoascus sp. VKM F-4518 (FW-2643)]
MAGREITNGGDSLKAVAVAAACKSAGCEVSREAILKSQSLRQLIDIVQMWKSDPIAQQTQQTHLGLLSRPPSVSSSAPQIIYSIPPKSTVSSVDIITTVNYNELERPSSTSSHTFSNDGQGPILANSFSDAYLSNGTENTTPTPTESESLSDAEDESLTEFQLSLIHGSLKKPGMNMIVHSETFYTDDIPLVKEAWKTVIEMEPIFQSPAIVEFYGENWKLFDWRVASTELAANYELSQDEMRHGGTGIGFFFEVFPCKPDAGRRDRCTIVWTVHHALIDGYSASLVFDKVRRAANGMKVERGPSFSRVVKDLKHFQQTHREAGDVFWQSKLQQNGTAKSELLLPQPLLKNANATSAELTIDISTFQNALFSKARDINVTPPSFFNAAWALTLASYADSDTVVFGAVLSGRTMPLPNVLTTIGPLVNTLPLFVNIQRSSSVEEYVRSVFLSLVELESFQWTTPANGFSRKYDSALALQFGQTNSPEYSIASTGSRWSQPDTEIPVTVAIHPGGKIQFKYHRNRYSVENVERVVNCFYEALQSLLRTHATVDASMESLLSCPSQALLKRYGNCISGLTTRGSIRDDLVTLHEKAASSFPENNAVERGDCSLTYRDFDHAASRLALELTHIIVPGDIVCVHSDRSINWLVAIFGILKAGGVYCSLDTALAPELRNSIYSFSGAKVFLTPSTAQLKLAPVSCEIAISVEGYLNNTDCSSGNILEHRKEPRPWQTAYLIFTSGSTGVPKGVSCTHAGLVAFQSDIQIRLFSQPGTKISQIMSAAFDGSIHELFSALTYGATLVLPSSSEPFDHLSLVDSAILTPSIARILNPQDYERLKSVYLVGEPVPQAVADKWATHKQLYNMYGPTEGTCGATIKQLKPGEPVTIGGPNPTTRIYLLNSRKALVQLGMIGEIYLAGVQIANGYLNLPEQNSERFLPDSICFNGDRMYKTGDRGYWSETGEIVCLGRNDREIKLRGYRLDMNDLEIRIANAVPELQAVAISRNGDQLVAMIQPAAMDTKDFQSRVAKILPPYAVPQQILPVDRLPMTGAGKVDYAAVARGCVAIRKSRAEFPRTGTEKKVAAAFRYVLRPDDNLTIFATSSFIELGGNSLQQLSLSKHLSKVFGFQVTLRAIIEYATVRWLAKCIDEYKSSDKKFAIQGKPLGHQEVSPIEREWLQKYAIDTGSSCFNVCFASTFEKGTVDRFKLTAAWNVVLNRHRILRCRYITRRGKAIGRTYTDIAPRAERLQNLNLWTEVNRPFQVDRANPVRVFITSDKLIVILSHIIADYTTLSILLKEASAVYNGQHLPPVTRNYADTKIWYDHVPQCYLDFWANYLKDSTDEVSGMQQERSGYQGESLISVVNPYTLRGMLDYSETAKVTLQQLTLAAVALSLDRDPSKTDIVLGSPYINRKSDEDLETVGLFLEPLPVRIKFEPSSSKESDQQETFMQAVQKSSQAALAHAIPWHRLLEHLSIDPSYPIHPLFDVMVTFHDNRQSSGLEMSVPGLGPCFLWSEGAKFKLMCEFTAVSETGLFLRLEYDTNCITQAEIRRIQSTIPLALSLLVKGLAHDDVKSRLANEELTCHETDSSKRLFGMRLCDMI